MTTGIRGGAGKAPLAGSGRWVTPEVNALATVILVGTLSVFGLGTLLLSGGRRFRRREAE